MLSYKYSRPWILNYYFEHNISLSWLKLPLNIRCKLRKTRTNSYGGRDKNTGKIVLRGRKKSIFKPYVYSNCVIKNSKVFFFNILFFGGYTFLSFKQNPVGI